MFNTSKLKVVTVISAYRSLQKNNLATLQGKAYSGGP